MLVTLFSLPCLSSLSSSLPFILFALLSILFPLFNVSSLQALQVSSFVLVDEVGLYMLYMTIFVSLSSYIFAPRSRPSSVSIFLIVLSCFMVFMSSNVVLIYFFYEASLLPILYIILNWGSYPERSLSAIMLLFYTSVFSLPFLYVLIYSFTLYSSFSLSNIQPSGLSFSLTLSVLSFLCFSVNLPIYGLHFWLPMAHVEAPTFGSIILAGVLLKLGGVGLIRVLPLFPSSLDVLLSYCIVGLVLVTIICCCQSDIKRLIAFSSVSHMIALPPLMFLITPSSLSSAILIMLFHGVSSPLLFMLVGFVYSSSSTRQLVYLRGFLLVYPLFSFISILGFLFSLSAPPFPSFVSEVMFFVCASHLSYVFLPFLGVFCSLSLVYNLNWLSSLLFSFGKSFSSTPLSFSSFLPMIIAILSAPLLIVLIGVL